MVIVNLVFVFVSLYIFFRIFLVVSTSYKCVEKTLQIGFEKVLIFWCELAFYFLFCRQSVDRTIELSVSLLIYYRSQINEFGRFLNWTLPDKQSKVQDLLLTYYHQLGFTSLTWSFSDLYSSSSIIVLYVGAMFCNSLSVLWYLVVGIFVLYCIVWYRN